MTTYPGEDPNAERPSGEPTAPIAPSSPVFNPTSAEFPGSEPTRPYPAYPSPYPPPLAPYGPPGYPPASGPGPYAPVGADHPQATTALIVGLIGLVGGLSFCGIGFVASPFAWAIGRNAVREIERSQGRIGGEGLARAGMIMGIVGTILLLIGVLALMLFAVAAVASSASTGSI